MPQYFAAMYAHIIFSTKNRTPLIGPTWKTRLFDYIGGIAKNDGFPLLAAGGMPDHVHLLVSIGREHSIAEIVRLVKTNSSKWIHETFPDQRAFAWQSGYAAFSVSKSRLPSVTNYIDEQEEHHRRKSFQEEFVEFLKKHDLPYDERYVWD
jgi:putative transposase